MKITSDTKLRVIISSMRDFAKDGDIVTVEELERKFHTFTSDGTFGHLKRSFCTEFKIVEEKKKIIQESEAVVKLGYSVGDLVTLKKSHLNKAVKTNHLYLVEALGRGAVKLNGIEKLVDATNFRRKFTSNVNLVLQHAIVNMKNCNPSIDDVYIEAYKTIVILKSGIVGVAKFNKADKKDFRVHAMAIALSRAVEAEQLKLISEKQQAKSHKEV